MIDRDAARGRYVILPRGDRRRRPIASAGEAVVMTLVSDGALEAAPGGAVRFVLTEAGRARAWRAAAAPNESYRAQHDVLTDRAWTGADGVERRARGVNRRGLEGRLRRRSDASGRASLTGAELAAAQRLREDWDVAQQGMVEGSDWSAPPRGGAPRGPSNGAETARISAIASAFGGCLQCTGADDGECGAFRVSNGEARGAMAIAFWKAGAEDGACAARATLRAAVTRPR